MLVIGQEFLDALPVHQFEFTSMGWCERLVDLATADPEEADVSPIVGVTDNKNKTNRPWFRLVNSPGKTPATVAFVRDHFEVAEEGDTLEVCPAACAVVQVREE